MSNENHSHACETSGPYPRVALLIDEYDEDEARQRRMEGSQRHWLKSRKYRLGGKHLPHYREAWPALPASGLTRRVSRLF